MKRRDTDKKEQLIMLIYLIIPHIFLYGFELFFSILMFIFLNSQYDMHK